ncbi:MAG: type II toxin-antitoxin system death-on-curing family toxin [Desulfobacteraceae bacterium]|nr:type II toxin-antitoxin system death-on-curing family toxin [Desulfobacteraceae bacterium]
MNPQWIDISVVLAIHEQQIAEHGGLLGIRDWGAIESALGRPQNFLLYETPAIFDLAAAYGFGLARNHGFVDGNKRTAYVVSRLFLILNGQDIHATAVEKVRIFVKVGNGEMDQPALAEWLRSRSLK